MLHRLLLWLLLRRRKFLRQGRRHFQHSPPLDHHGLDPRHCYRRHGLQSCEVGPKHDCKVGPQQLEDQTLSTR